MNIDFLILQNSKTYSESDYRRFNWRYTF